MNGLINAVGAWWSGISVREQRLLVACSLLIVLAAVYWGLLKPMAEREAQATTRITSEKQLLSWVSDKADEIVSLRGTGGASLSSTPLNQVVSSSTRRYSIELIRMQPRNDALQVWVKPIEFNRLINWLAFFKEKHGIDVEFMDIEATDNPGVVEVKRLQLKRGL